MRVFTLHVSAITRPKVVILHVIIITTTDYNNVNMEYCSEIRSAIEGINKTIKK